LSKPTILFLIDGLQVGGAERSLLLLCQHLRDFRPIVLVISDSHDLMPDFENAGIQVEVFSLTRNYRFRQHAKTIKPLVDSLNPAIIHSSLFHADMILRYLDTPAIKVTGLVSAMYSDGRLNPLPWQTRQKVRLLKQWDCWTSSKIDLFISNSNTIRNHYVSDLGNKPEKVKVIYRGRRIQTSNSDIQRKENQFLFIGRLIPSKGLETAIKAFKKISRKKPHLIFKIAGEGPQREGLLRLIQKLDLEEKVILLGQVNDVDSHLADSSFFIFPTHYEGLPGSLIEAMLAKIPIICSDIPENKECVDESMCLFHRVGDSEDLAIQMERALTLTDWEERTQRAYAHAAEHFDIENIARQYEEVYQKLLSEDL
tara:strand:+ start:55 stop:1161 length:1107 start_codon:yes stop_codon:yes gene_type:complete